MHLNYQRKIRVICFAHKILLFSLKKKKPGQKDMQHKLDPLWCMLLQPAKYITLVCYQLTFELNRNLA